MRNLGFPFRFKMSGLVKRARDLPLEVDGVSLSFFGLSVNAKPNNVERNVAREIMVRMADKRVLNASECCDNCVEGALASLQEVRQLLVDKQVELRDRQDGSLFLLIDMQREAIKQFLTFVQRLGPFNQVNREQYFAALDMLRAHIAQCLRQIALVADVPMRIESPSMLPADAWLVEAYEPTLAIPLSDSADTRAV